MSQNFYEARGIVHEIGAVQQKQSRLGSPFNIQTIVIHQVERRDDGTKFDNYPQFEFSNIDQLTGFSEGDDVMIHFDVRGVQYTGKDGDTRYFTKLHGFRCAHYVDPLPKTLQPQEPLQQPQPQPAQTPQQQSMFDDDGLPF